VEGGGWRGGWRVEGGGWRVEGGGWRVEVGGWRLEVGGWRLEVGGWRLEVGGWRLEGGGWRRRERRGGRRVEENYLNWAKTASKASVKAEVIAVLRNV
jgi:hypothetical protein